MRMRLTKTSQTPSAETQSAYMKQARRHIRRAARLYPDLSPFLALIFEIWQRRDVLRPRTVRLYRVELKVAFYIAGRQDARSDERIQRAYEICMRKLEQLKGRPQPARTASRKVKDPTLFEVEQVFGELKRHAMETKNMLAAAAAFYCVIAPRIGPRPKELLGAKIDGHFLTFPNAKATPRHPDTRSLNLSQFGDAFLEAAVTLVALIEKQVATLGFERWRNAMSETLARACAKKNIRRLSLYSFRHVAIATWEKAGFSKEEIARMAGHLGLDTAHLHYARGKHGWAAKAVAQPVITDENTAENIDEKSLVEPVAASKSDSPGKFDDKAVLAQKSAPDLWGNYKGRLDAKLGKPRGKQVGKGEEQGDVAHETASPAATKSIPGNNIAADDTWRQDRTSFHDRADEVEKSRDQDHHTSRPPVTNAPKATHQEESRDDDSNPPKFTSKNSG